MENGERERGEMKCPRCGRSYPESAGAFCPVCRAPLIGADAPGPTGPESTLRVRVSPVIGEALSSAQPGEDFDEALLRALKARYPEQAAALLSALSRLIEIEARQAHEDKQQVVSRLARSQPGPEIVLRTSGGEAPRMLAETRIIRIGGKEYGSLEEVPPHLRRIVQEGLQRGKAEPGPKRGRGASRTGCAWGLAAGWLVALLRTMGK